MVEIDGADSFAGVERRLCDIYVQVWMFGADLRL